MKCEFKNPATGIRDTPLRMLIKSFPDLANRVFDKCMQTNLQGTQDTDTKVIIQELKYKSNWKYRRGPAR